MLCKLNNYIFELDIIMIWDISYTLYYWLYFFFVRKYVYINTSYNVYMLMYVLQTKVFIEYNIFD